MKLSFKKHSRELEYLRLSEPKRYESELKWLRSVVKSDRIFLINCIVMFLVFLFAVFVLVYKISHPEIKVEEVVSDTRDSMGLLILFQFLMFYFWGISMWSLKGD